MNKSSDGTKNASPNARDIAARALRDCATEVGFTAGRHHFVDLWARDSLFATFGANVIGLSSATKKTITTFLRYRTHSGYIPYLLLRSRHSIGKYFGHQTYYAVPKAVSRSHMSFGIVPDGGIMTIIAMRLYVETSHDMEFLKKHYSSLVRAISWYTNRFDGGLVREWFQCEWADAILKSGNTLYTNVLYFRAASDMAWLSARVHKLAESVHYELLAKQIQRGINDTLWNGLYFSDWHDWRRHDYFASHPNMLAIIFGLATKEQAESILFFARKRAWNGWTLINSVPEYPIWRVPIFHTLLGLKDYHNGFIWLQPGILYAVAQYKSGKKKEAKKTLTAIGKKIVQWNGAYEVYERNSTPVRRRIYTSEHPFAWSAGLFVWAWDMIR